MATDPRLLLAELDEYASTLERHFVELRDRHTVLRDTWLATSEVYRGTGAEVFADAFARADARFFDYLDRGHRILVILREKMEQLRLFDDSGGRSF